MGLSMPLGHGRRSQRCDQPGYQSDPKQRIHVRTIVAWSMRGRTAHNYLRERMPRKSFGHAAALFTRPSSFAQPLAAARSFLFGFP